MGRLLRIGEVAGLLGVSTKTVRHYHKVGLLPEPERSESGYRLYTAADVLRLHRARRLQALGFSLAQAREALRNLDDEPSFRGLLQGLLEDTCVQLRALEERRYRLKELLALDALDTLDALPDTPPTVRLMRERLGGLAEGVSAELWEQETRIWALLDGFSWPPGYEEMREAVIERLAAHPEEFEDMLRIGERFAALAGAPEDAPEVEALSRDFKRYAEVHRLAEGWASDSWADGPLAEVFAQLMETTLSPAQRRCLDMTGLKDAPPEGGGAPAGREEPR
jgi:DNA-binding transcriptional MerR regulator